MKQIPLNKGQFAKVSDEDFERLSGRKWNALAWDRGFYAVTSKGVKMERLVTGDFTAYCIDHMDRDTLNNQRDNLRPADQTQNACNRSDKQTPKSALGFGVRKVAGGFVASVSIFGRRLTLGKFPYAAEAQRAYDALKFLTVGDFAPLNLPRSMPDSIVSLREHLRGARAEYVAGVVAALGTKREAAKALGISEASIYRV